MSRGSQLAKQKLARKLTRVRQSDVPRVADVALALERQHAATLDQAPTRLNETAAALNAAANERLLCPRCGTRVQPSAQLSVSASELHDLANELNQVAARLGQGGATLWFARR